MAACSQNCVCKLTTSHVCVNEPVGIVPMADFAWCLQFWQLLKQYYLLLALFLRSPFSYYNIPLLTFLEMARITDLHLNILRKVLAYFYHGTIEDYNLQEFRQLLPLAAVCRVWRECMLPYVYHIAHLEYHINEIDEENETAHPKYEWKSNVNLIVSQRLSSATRRLRIKSFECPLNFTDMAHALDTFGFSSNHWRAVNSLSIDTVHISNAVDDNAPSSSDDKALAAQLTEYFGRHLPNICDLYILIHPRPNAIRLLSNKLVNLYNSQLHSLRCFSAPITFNCHSFSSKLRCLTTGIAPGAANRLPQLLASPLEKLVLFDIPLNFAWWTFIGITPSHIEFTNLTFLKLAFQQQSENAEGPNISNRHVGMDTVSFNIGYRKLYFPVLKSLGITNSPYNDGALYSMFIHSPLQTIRIWSSFKSVQCMDLRILFNTTNVRFNIYGISPDNYSDNAEFYCKLLCTPSNARTALLGMDKSSVPLPIPSTIEWINLEHVNLAANIHLASVIQIVARLPKLHTMQIENVVDETNEAAANLQALLEGNLTQMLGIATSVKSLSIYSNYRPLMFSLDVIHYLTILIQSLDNVVVPDLYVSEIKEFVVCYANSFPHLHDIKVLCECSDC